MFKQILSVGLLLILILLMGCTSSNSDSYVYVNSENNYSFVVPSGFTRIEIESNDVAFSNSENLLVGAFSGSVISDKNTTEVYKRIREALPSKLNAEVLFEKKILVNGYEAERLDLSYKLNEIDLKYH